MSLSVRFYFFAKIPESFLFFKFIFVTIGKKEKLKKKIFSEKNADFSLKSAAANFVSGKYAGASRPFC